MHLQISNELNDIISYSKEEAMRLGSYVITTDHLMLGIIRHGVNRATTILSDSGVDLHAVKRVLESKSGNSAIIDYDNSDKISLSKASENALKLMFLEARAMQNLKPDSLHLLLAILRDHDYGSIDALSEYGITYSSLKEKISGNKELSDNHDEELDSLSLSFENKSNLESENNDEMQSIKKENNSAKKSKGTPIIENFGYDLTKAAAEDKLDPVVGREREIERLAQILGRRKKNNPVLIGEPGAGKSAIAEGLAIRIAQKNVSRVLMNKKIISLDIGSVVAGTKYRGQFEERMKALLKEASANPDIILFIDELHTLIGAGGAAGSLDAANMLKPALARGDIQCIGATTLDEYRQVIEKDGALERRFQKIMVEPTDFDQTYAILNDIKIKYEQHHNVKYTDDAIRACISLSNRYISDRCLPDKAIDIMDEAGSKAHLENIKVPKEISELEQAIELIKGELSAAVAAADYKMAANYRDARDIKTKELEEAKVKWETDQALHPAIVGKEEIAAILSMATHIPITKIAETEGNRLMNMALTIQKKIIGQNNAVETISKAIRRNRAGLKDPGKPIGTFLFLGPTGVGKTQLAKILAEYLFDSQESLIRIDMSEYMEKYAVSRLIGAPPGYVGYNEGGQLSERVRRHPYSVVLLDEIEKAHPDIFNLLLQVLDEGRLTDSNGRNIDFRNTVLILTSNIGSRELKAYGNGLGFANSVKRNVEETERSIIEKAVGKVFTPEFLNRLDEQILFNTLNQKDIEKIVEIELSSLYKRIEQTGYKLEFAPNIKKFIAEHGYDPQLGARPLKRAIQKYVEDPVSEAIIKRRAVTEGETENKTITITFTGRGKERSTTAN
jgi:ATP-dependent Clp protease ATP-binding subunit ClpC